MAIIKDFECYTEKRKFQELKKQKISTTIQKRCAGQKVFFNSKMPTKEELANYIAQHSGKELTEQELTEIIDCALNSAKCMQSMMKGQKLNEGAINYTLFYLFGDVFCTDSLLKKCATNLLFKFWKYGKELKIYLNK